MSQRLGPYTLESKIADGGMAEVFLASKQGAEGWSRQVVLKRILPQYADRAEFRALFQHEALLASPLAHANLTLIHDYLEIDGSLAIVQEHLHGRDLRQLAGRAAAPLAWEVVAYLGLEVLKAIEYLHDAAAHPQAGVVLHRDVSPHNIVVGYDGQVKLVDLGIAQGTKQALELLIELPGKRAYMAPEALQHNVYETRSELFSFALTMIEVLCRVPAQALREMTATRRQALLHERGVPAVFATCLQNCLLPEPSQRPSSASWLRTALAEVLKAQAVTAQAVQRQVIELMQQLYPSEAERAYEPLQQTAVLHDGGTRMKPLTMQPWQFGVLVMLFVGIWLWPRVPVGMQRPATRLTMPSSHSAGVQLQKSRVAQPAGTLDIDSFPWSSVYLNGRFLGVTPLKQLEVPAGDYQLYMVTRDGRTVEMPLNVEPGNRRQLFRQIP